MIKSDIVNIYQKLLDHFGKRNWWPAETPFEIIVGAILTQQTTWKNVERAINNLKRENLMNIDALAKADISKLEKTIRSSGFFRQKASRLKNIASHLMSEYNSDLNVFFDRDTNEIREELLALKGIGQETADSILLYAGGKPIFVVDGYTIRICERLGLCAEKNYDEVQKWFMKRLPKAAEVYGEMHALIVELGKHHCKAEPKCNGCPLMELCSFHSKNDYSTEFQSTM